MRRITVMAPVKLSPERAEQALERYIDKHRDQDGSLVVELRASLPENATSDLKLSHDVTMRVRKGRDASGLNDTLLVDWSPTGEGPFPRFAGVLNVLGSTDPTQSSLEIDGTYEAPADGVGALFDSLVGSRIAEISLSDLATRLALEIRTG